MTQNNSQQIQQLINDGALFFVSHSGGKDSQAMYALLRNQVPAEQLIVVHAHLGEVEWPGVLDHIKGNINHPLHVVSAKWRDGTEKTFLNMVERRHAARPDVPPWPSTKHRQCTSDLKRDPIHSFIRRTCKERGVNLAVNCTGMRAQESNARAKLQEFELCKRLCNQTRTVYEWRPIHAWSTDEVFSFIADAGQQPFWAYKENERLSCMFCIMGCKGDLQHAARQNPELAAKYVELEQRTNSTMFHTKSLASIIASDYQ